MLSSRVESVLEGWVWRVEVWDLKVWSFTVRGFGAAHNRIHIVWDRTH